MADFNPYLPPAAPLDATAGSATAQTLNPWLSMWTRPRATIQQIIEENPERLVLLLAAIGGISEVLDRASVKSLGDKMELTMIFVMAALAGPVIGISGLYIGGALLHWTGGWIGGKAPAVNIRAAMAWSNVLLIWALLLWIPSVALFGSEVFATETPRIDANPSLAYVLIGLAAIELVIGMWAFVAFLKCLGQVQGFSAGKPWGTPHSPDWSSVCLSRFSPMCFTQRPWCSKRLRGQTVALHLRQRPHPRPSSRIPGHPFEHGDYCPLSP